MKPIIVFYHCAFFFPETIHGHPPGIRPRAVEIIQNQMAQVAGFGLHAAASEIIVGVNGGVECAAVLSDDAVIPKKAKVILHGVEAKSETPTIVLLREKAIQSPESNILYFHSKGATHTDPAYSKFVDRWRTCMMNNLIIHWQRCIADLEAGFDSVGCHWMTNMSPPSDKDSIWGGNFFWAKASFLATLPNILESDLIRQHGVASAIARYEGERWIGTGPTLPKIKDYHVNGIGQCP